ncbi:MAG: aminodeoxychorismate synthase component I [Candidatus Omnitrophota bacterium]|jgi:para-aminobenzoate synthetase/4-amino-4-deoxychorismate lyase
MVKLPRISSSYIDKHKYFMLFETKLCDRLNFMSYIFVNPIKVIRVYDFKDVENAFIDIEKYSKRFYLAGYFSYELGYYFEKGIFKDKITTKTPLIHLGVFDKRFYFNHKTKDTNMKEEKFFVSKAQEEDFSIRNLKLNISPEEYRDKVLRIKEYISRGDTYQVNFTTKYNFDFSGSPLALYNRLALLQHVQYGAFCKLDNHHILSFSPELFFRREGLKIYSQPMKGTIARGRNPQEDTENIKKLRRSLKNRAENLMIVDLVRNDLGRISRIDSVKISEAFKVRRYETISQMTSQVNSRLKRGATYFEIFKNIFPGGSVTGAPKIRTMQIIRELERGYPRGVYCGALGFISKRNQAVFNLPIRTLSVLRGKGEMGVGSGIVYDSSPAEEFMECKLKARFLIERDSSLRLIETIGWDKGYLFLKEHLRRMEESAGYFGFSCNPWSIRRKLAEIERKLIRTREYKVRLLLGKYGDLNAAYSPIGEVRGVKKVAISKYRINPASVFLRHKTTNRSLYDREYSRYKARGYFDVIFLNNRQEVSEGAISNIVIERRGRLYTPPFSSGLLPGIFRGDLLRKGIVKEKIMHFCDLLEADRVYLCNSVRGMARVELKI